jgi:uncharacterized protein (DUF1697 family)
VGGMHVALIRGINIGRAKRVAMSDLRSLLEALGHRDVRTLLNSGNAVFTSRRRKPEEIAGQIERAMLGEMGIPTRVVLLTRSEFATVVEENPLPAVASDPTRVIVAFCRDTDRLEQLAPLKRKDWGTNALAIGSRAAYVWCANGILASELLNAVGRTLGESMTTRNWATVTKIHAALHPPARKGRPS